MYRLLIVDDNPRDQKGLKTILNWEAMGIVLAGTCENGQEVLENIDVLKPDIILTDVCMPVMSGIEMAVDLRNQYPHIKVIFMSSHYEFDFAKSAIDLNVYGYVLKPIIKEELKSAITKVLNVYETENSLQTEKNEMLKQLNQSLHLFQEQFIRELLFGNSITNEDLTTNAAFLKMNLSDHYIVQVLTIEIDNYEDHVQAMSIDDKYLISYTIKQLVSSFNCLQNPNYIFQLSHKRFVLVLFDIQATLNDIDSKNTLLDIIVELKEQISNKLGINTTMGISNASTSLDDIPTLYEQSLTALNTKFYSNSNQLILYEEIEEYQHGIFEIKVNLQELYKEVKDIIFSGNPNYASLLIKKYLDSDLKVQNESYVKNFTFNLITIIQTVLDQENISLDNIFEGNFIVWNKLSRFETIKDIQQWLFNVLTICIQHINDHNCDSQSKIVEDVKNVIHERYGEYLTIENISEHINFSPSYANRVFKAQTNKTIFDYLTDFRMEKAKELLRHPNSKIYMVAKEVGYTNKSHFCFQFKKYTGMTPTEYKNTPIINEGGDVTC